MPRLLEDTDESLDASVRLFERWDGAEGGRLRYVFSPRHAPSCSFELMQEVGQFAAAHSARVQSHLSENRSEVEWVRSLFPQFPSYTAVYVAAGLLGPESVMGHGVHLDDTEMSWLVSTNTTVAFCPCSNRTLHSGAMAYSRLREKGVAISLGTDVAGGTSLSMFRQMSEAFNTANEEGPVLSPAGALYLATLGGASALGISRVTGSLEPGKDADFLVLRPGYDGPYNGPEQTLSRLCFLGDQQWVEEVWIQGQEVYRKNR